jgi:hypothetical protein
VLPLPLLALLLALLLLLLQLQATQGAETGPQPQTAAHSTRVASTAPVLGSLVTSCVVTAYRSRSGCQVTTM